MAKKTLYEFLGVEPEATPDEIKVAAQHLAKKFHPTKYPNNPRVAAYFKKIKLVYNKLANPQKRAAYDAALAKKMAETQSAQHSAFHDSEPSKQNVSPPPKKVQNIAQKTVESAIDFEGSEKIIYRADIHWIGYLRALLVMGISAYLLWIDPAPLMTIVDKLDFLADKYIILGLQFFLGVGGLMLLQTLFQQFTTTLTITSERIMAKWGLMSKKQVQMELIQFEHLEIKQGFLGKILGFGTIRMRGKSGKSEKGVGGIKIHVKNVASPKKFEKRLMRVIKQCSYHQI